MSFAEAVELVAKAFDVAGIVAVVGGVSVATARAAVILRRDAPEDAYRTCRRRIGRSILLGLEFLVAADIIRLVAIAPTFRGVGILALIVLIRTFLSFALEVELEGRWPWQRGDTARAPSPD